MKVILKDNIKGVGKKNEVINASDGYARNFLFPKNLAVEATPENMQKLNSQNQAKQYKKDQEKEALNCFSRSKRLTIYLSRVIIFKTAEADKRKDIHYGRNEQRYVRRSYRLRKAQHRRRRFRCSSGAYSC